MSIIVNNIPVGTVVLTAPASGSSVFAFPTSNGTNGYVLSTDGSGTTSWIPAGAGGVGTVTTVSVASSNGFAGTVANATSTPAITLTTSITGMLKGSSSALAAATSGTDYSAGTSALGTGILKSTTGTGALTIAVAADFPTLNQSTTGSAASLSATLATTSGGTNIASYTTGDILYASATNVLSKLAIGSTGNALVIAGGVPTWGSVAASPAGSDTQVQYNNAGVLAGSTDFVWTNSTRVLTLGASISGGVVFESSSNASGSGVPATLRSGSSTAATGVGGNLTIQSGSTSGSTGNAATNKAGNLVIAAGSASGIGNGGIAQINGGSAGSGSGGSISFTAGSSSSGGQGGAVTFNTGTGSGGIGLMTFKTGGVNGLILDANANLISFKAIADQSTIAVDAVTAGSSTVTNNTSTLLLGPTTTTIATYTITFPTTPIDGQLVRVTTAKTITALTLSPNAGQTIVGTVPTTISAGSSFSYMYNLANTSWYPLSAASSGGGGGATVTPTTSASTFYPVFSSTTSGSLSVANIDNTLNLTYVPSTGTLSAANFVTTSDQRLKDNIAPITDALNTVKQLQGVSFNFKGNETPTFGFIAQQVEQVLPTIVNTDDGGMKSVNYLAIIAQLVEAVKTLEQRIVELENK